MNNTCILWFRKDLRLDDNPALIEAAKHKKIIPLFIFDRNLEEYNKIGEASHWWLEKSLISLSENDNPEKNGAFYYVFLTPRATDCDRGH